MSLESGPGVNVSSNNKELPRVVKAISQKGLERSRDLVYSEGGKIMMEPLCVALMFVLVISMLLFFGIDINEINIFKR